MLCSGDRPGACLDALKQIYFFLFKMYLFDCAGSQLQHMKFLIISAHRVFS